VCALGGQYWPYLICFSAFDTLHFGSFIASQTPQSIRKPLETLSLEGRSDDTMFDDSPRTQPTRRGRLLRERPREHSSASPSPSLVPRNAFDVLRDAASKTKQREHRTKQDLGKSEYVEVEAQESDEEAMLGFGGVKGKDDDDEGGDDPNMVVEGLVDDSVLDATVQAADLVLEKHMSDLLRYLYPRTMLIGP
jgi:mediator of replication checkpoint protein 1